MISRQQIARYTSIAAVALFTTLGPSSVLAAGPSITGADATVRDDDTAAFVGDVVVGSLETAADATQFAFGIVEAAHH